MKNRILIISGIILIIVAGVIIVNIKRPVAASEQKQPNSSTGAGKPVSELLAKAKSAEAKGSLLDIRNAYQELINNFPSSNEMMNWQKKVEDINIKLLFSSILTPKSILYEIKPGDTLIKISKEFKTTPELIAKANNLSGDKIFPGKKIKIWSGPLSILVDKSQNILILKSEEEVIKTYIVSTGANNSSPVGTYKIVNKLPNPTWFKAGAVVPADSPENVLGTRWMGFDLPGYGIHGTVEPQNLGKQVTQGCVRMANPEVEELYTIVPQNTEVTIID